MADNELRRERYRQLRALGFSSADARKLRSQSDTKREAAISNRQRKISRKSKSERTEPETRQLQAIREYRIQRRAGLVETDTRSTRLANFREWSKKSVGFPESITQRIIQINIDAGRDPYDKYGFRVFYHVYVNGRSRQTAERFVRDGRQS